MAFKTETVNKNKIDEPKKYVVIIHNDNYTLIDLVIVILMKIFRKSSSGATLIANEAHANGSSIVDTYTKEIAETKILQATSYARRFGSPLKLTIEDA